jgi:predicted metal-dependent peptidase
MTPKKQKASNVMEKVYANRENPVTDAERDAVLARVSHVRARLTQYMPFFGHLVLKMEPIITRKVLLAGVTRDRKLLLNPDWAIDTDITEFAGTMVHEVLHLAFLFWDRMGGRNLIAVGPEGSPVSLWNIASDFTVNAVIQEMVGSKHQTEVMDPVKWDPPGLLDAKYRDWSSEEIYDDLLQSAIDNGKKGKAGGSKGEGGTIFVPGCDATKADVQMGEGEGEGEGEGKGQPLTEQEKRTLDQFWKVTLIEAVQVHESRKEAGTLPGSVKKLVNDILDPRVPWAEVLSLWVGENGRKTDFSYRRPSRRSESVQEILPTLQKYGVDDVVVIWDTSGSMNGRETEILSEIIGICEDLSLSLRVITCDTMVHQDIEEVRSADDIVPEGGGGSDFCPAFDKLIEDYYEGVVVAFTDGWIRVPEEKPPLIRDVLWVNWQHDVDPTGGKWGSCLNVDVEGFTR